ncbi:hypothetical protein GOBAR_DD14973 [Gossypium barbadense]|nr:hypothetical protein GOBAR_DD14973 [Gossypium barbadense]
MYKDMEDFLFKMLGEEFRLERDAIQVLNRCGYDMQKVVDAFVKGDQDQANKILEQKNLVGSFIRFHSLLSFSRNTEIEEEMLLELHDHGIEEEMLLELHDHGIRDAIQL